MKLVNIHDLLNEKGGHTAVLTRGPMIIYINCAHCSFSTIWQPDESTPIVAARWNQAHRR